MSKFCHIFPLINYRQKLGRGYYYKGNNQGWGVTAALRVTLRDMTETYVAVAWDRAVPDDHAS